MRKYSYFNYIKTGAWEATLQFFYNRKSYVGNHHSLPNFSIGYTPAPNGYYIKKWFYEQNKTLKNWYTIKDYSTYNKLTEDFYPEEINGMPPHQGHYESPFLTSRNTYNMKHWAKDNVDQPPVKYYNCAYEIFDYDHMTFPATMLGYYGNMGEADEVTKCLEDLTPQHPPPNLKWIVEQFKLRCNIVPYKEDVESLVHTFVRSAVGPAQWKLGEDKFIEICVHRLKNHKKTCGLITRMLEYHCIPWTPFNLDRDSYSDIFPDLEKIYPVKKAIHDHDTWMDDPMSPKRKLKLKYYVDKVLCSL
tara:strand:- start:30 stop:938 length:909 start_codon:yes stop_codon:yes gene_type:complete